MLYRARHVTCVTSPAVGYEPCRHNHVNRLVLIQIPCLLYNVWSHARHCQRVSVSDSLAGARSQVTVLALCIALCFLFLEPSLHVSSSSSNQLPQGRFSVYHLRVHRILMLTPLRLLRCCEDFLYINNWCEQWFSGRGRFRSPNFTCSMYAAYGVFVMRSLLLRFLLRIQLITLLLPANSSFQGFFLSPCATLPVLRRWSCHWSVHPRHHLAASLDAQT